MRYIIGIDEAGRGPLAGPVAVGAVKIPNTFKELPPGMRGNLKDSKKLNEKRREEIYTWIVTHPKIKHSVGLSSNKRIDAKGIVPAISTAMWQALSDVHDNNEHTLLKLDGALHAPKDFIQETIIKGDEKELAIALASIVAKVTRDRYMCKMATKFPQYGFEKHKGYGTPAHYRAIREYGLTTLHRKTFCKQ